MNKSKTFAKQISLHIQQQQHLCEMQCKIDLEDENQSKHAPRTTSTCGPMRIVVMLHAWYTNSISTKHCELIFYMSSQGFLPKLKDHLLSCLLGGNEFTDLDHHNLSLINNCIYSHQILQINYTTYDVQQNKDSINLHTCSDIMMLTCEDNIDDWSHPYLYARVIGIFHATV